MWHIVKLCVGLSWGRLVSLLTLAFLGSLLRALRQVLGRRESSSADTLLALLIREDGSTSSTGRSSARCLLFPTKTWEPLSVLTEEIQLPENRPKCFEKHLQSVDGETLKRTCVDFTLLGYFRIELELCDTDAWMWTSTLGLSLSPLLTVIDLGCCTRSVS